MTAVAMLRSEGLRDATLVRYDEELFPGMGERVEALMSEQGATLPYAEPSKVLRFAIS